MSQKCKYPVLLLLLALWPYSAIAYDLKDNAILHAQQGQECLNHNQTPEAVDEFNAALALNPYTSLSASIYNNLGIAYRRLKRYSEAIQAFQQACRLRPTFSLYFKNLIDTYAAAGRLSLAKQRLKEVFKANPLDAEACFMLGLIAKKENKPQEAQRYFKRFIQLEPNSDMRQAAQI